MKAYIKMEETIVKFDDIKILKQRFHQHKRLILIKNVDIHNSADNLLLNKTIQILIVTIVMRAVFVKLINITHSFFADESLHKI